jgi:hypothetical protein
VQTKNDVKIYEPVKDEMKKYYLRPRDKSKEIHTIPILITHPSDTFDNAQKLKCSIPI